MSNIVRIDDYNGTPRYYDLGTQNESFLLTARELKDLGVKNWYFMLEVKFPTLGVQDMDAFDENLSPDNIAKIAYECKHNPWYFFREVSRVPIRGAGTTRLYLHRAGCAAIWSFMHSIDFELVQPRQTYKTTVLTAIMSYMFLFEYRNADIPYLHKTETRCTENVGILRDYIQALPKWMNPWYGQKHPPGLQSLKYDKHNVSIAVLSAPKSESSGTDKPRGYSLFTWFADECEFIPYMKAIIDGSNSTIVQARLTAEANGLRSCMMYASTPGDLETKEGKEWQTILDNLPKFDEKYYYDLTDEQIKELKRPTGNNINEAPLTMLYIEFNYIQLRKDLTWLRAQYFEAIKKSTLGEYRRGVLLQRFRGGEGSFFRQEDIDYIQQHLKDPDYDIKLMDKYHLYVYKHDIQCPDLNSETPYFDINIPYLIGLDCATGKGGDNTAICILHPYTLEVVGELISPYIGGLDLMRLVTILARMLPRALFCIESNMTGVDIIDFVQESPLQSRFYFDPRSTELTKNVVEPKQDKVQMNLKRKALEKKHYGTYVNEKVRKTMFNILRETLHDYKHLISTKFLVKDIANLIEHKNGKIAAADGEHDDMVMAYLHTLYILKYGYDLGRYGINKNLCSYSKATEIMVEYKQKVAEETIDNSIPNNPGSFEAQLFNDLTRSVNAEYNNNSTIDGYDDYGYKHAEYQQYGQLQQTPVRGSVSDLSFFREVNDYGISGGSSGGGFSGFGLF